MAKALKTLKFPGIAEAYTVPVVDNTLSIEGAAADAKAVYDAIQTIQGGGAIGSLPDMTGILPVAKGGTGVTTVDEIKKLLGLKVQVKELKFGLQIYLTDLEPGVYVFLDHTQYTGLDIYPERSYYSPAFVMQPGDILTVAYDPYSFYYYTDENNNYFTEYKDKIINHLGTGKITNYRLTNINEHPQGAVGFGVSQRSVTEYELNSLHIFSETQPTAQTGKIWLKPIV